MKEEEEEVLYQSSSWARGPKESEVGGSFLINVIHGLIAPGRGNLGELEETETETIPR